VRIGRKQDQVGSSPNLYNSDPGHPGNVAACEIAMAGSAPVRRWHEYYDWGGLTDPTCQPGEDGQKPVTLCNASQEGLA
jgi:hypothetical protein